MSSILLNDILQISSNELPNVRIKFNIDNGYNDPMDLYLENPDKINIEWFLWKDKRRYFYKGQIAICFLKMTSDTWLMTAVKRIKKELDVDPDRGGIGYEADDIAEYQKYCGRLVVKYHNTSRSMGRKFESVMQELEVLQILNDRYTGEDFPGYENTRLSYRQLKNIIDRQLPGWIAALQNQKAVYLLTDTKTGKLYVGSATAQEGMLLQRWSAYIHNGHGGNRGLIELVQQKGFDYIKKYFVYTILENYNATIDDKYVLTRESWWKDTLRTRDFGYNKI